MRLAFLDVLRLISIGFVMFGHFVSVGGGANSIPGIIGLKTQLPLLNNANWELWKFEIFLIEKFSTQSAILGVTLFFLVTGYLIPMMLERYSRSIFLVNRIFRIFPVLFVAVIILGSFVKVTQNILFDFSSYWASWSLSYLVFGIVPVTGVLWTLLVEVLFYSFAAIIGKFTVYKLMFFQVSLLAVILACTKFSEITQLLFAATQAKYLLMISIGTAIYLAEKEQSLINKVILVSVAIFFSYLGFQLFKQGHEDVSTYCNLGTHLLATILFLSLFGLSKLNLFNKLPSWVITIADLVYPIYLIHATIGLGTMALVRDINNNPYVLLLSAIFASLSMAWMLHRYVEKPGILLGKRICRTIENKAVN